ncbi:D-glycero-alpha-D-manno-heptose-1,7-bisphosphate 7-phosphatase [Draconibacterium halophilum]|uniref:D,D-heptose 1,7-bisphosphate phosphatase n=1 Tax=Draconibacterium halophilum TaxID=2706887 RepID=A0A6C0RBT3_9BACT|nr:HAD family hydrolase [Draconibacterium halophilum]QIA07225.1 HAD family hydrolase [Draconibacterium halophilum]
MTSRRKNKALFLDRDGTINVEKNYVFRIEDFEFIPGIFELLKKYYDKGFMLFIVTNQSGIARKYYTGEDFIRLNNWMVQQFKYQGIEITKVYHCPHHPEITGNCNCRKPEPGMILQAIREFNIDPVNSVLIGDKKRDILAGEKAGIGKNLYIQNLLQTGLD